MQCTLTPSNYEGVKPVYISGVTGGSQQLSVLKAEVNLTGNEWQKYPIVTGLEAPCILGIGYLKKGYFKDLKGYQRAFGIAALEEKEQSIALSGLSKDPFVVGVLNAKDRQIATATATVHQWQHHINQDSVIPIYKLIQHLERQKDNDCQQNEPILTWLLPCWDMGANGLELEGEEAKQLGSLSREVGIYRATGT